MNLHIMRTMVCPEVNTQRWPKSRCTTCHTSVSICSVHVQDVYFVLCCVVLCCVVLYCVVLCCVVLCCVVLCCVVLCCVVLCCVVLCCVVLCCVVLCCVVLCCVKLEQAAGLAGVRVPLLDVCGGWLWWLDCGLPECGRGLRLMVVLYHCWGSVIVARGSLYGGCVHGCNQYAFAL